MWLLAILLFVVCINVCADLTHVCPVSSSLSFHNNGNHYYPIEIYNSNMIVNGTISIPHEICQAQEYQTVNYSCPLKLLSCPLIKENLKDGIKLSDWKKTKSVCGLKSQLQNSSANINVYVFGGSVTIGVDTVGCCSAIECYSVNGKRNFRCAWPQYLEGWLQSYGKANITVHNLGRGGTTVDISGERVPENFRDIEDLSDNDIIIVDHSFNDNPFCNQETHSRMERGLEKLIRYLLSYTANVMPTIILLETSTVPSPIDGYRSCYDSVYQPMARHYGIRLYSFVEAVLTNTSKVLQSSYHQHLTHEFRRKNHPPWHAHLVYADFVAALLLHEMNLCNDTRPQLPLVPYVLPSVKTNLNKSLQCNRRYKPYLRMSYEDIMANTTIGSYNISVKDSWQVKLDHKGRGGIIAELTNSSVFSEMYDATIEFTLDLTLRWLRATPGIGIQFMFMRSYTNSGGVAFNICGRDLFEGTVDALWKDRNYHYTTPDVKVFQLFPDNCRYDNQSENVKIALKYKPFVDEDNRNNMTQFIASQPRTARLFNILSLIVCKY